MIRAGRFRIRNPDRIFLVSVGKAAVPMALAAHRALGARIDGGVVIAPHRAPPMPRTRSFVASHPLPDQRGLRAATQVIQMLERTRLGDLVLLLLSGGASALMPAPLPGITLEQKQRLTRLLLNRGAAISEMNAVRARLSRLKGGGFARLAAPAQVVTLALSDVPGDDLRVIGSGPTVFNPRAAAQAQRTVEKFLDRGEVPPSVRAALRAETEDIAGPESHALVIGSGLTFARAAARQARELGFRVRILPNALRGEARRCGPVLVRRFEALRRSHALALIATGETVVNVRGHGRGGRNQELALAAVGPLGRLNRPAVLAALATDGRDGASDAGGGMVDDSTAKRAADRGIPLAALLDDNDSTRALAELGCLIQPANSRTNVADITLILG